MIAIRKSVIFCLNVHIKNFLGLDPISLQIKRLGKLPKCISQRMIIRRIKSQAVSLWLIKEKLKLVLRLHPEVGMPVGPDLII